MPNYTLLLALLFFFLNAQAQRVDKNQVMEYLQEQQYDDAIHYLQATVDTTNTRELALLGYTYYQAGKITEAAAVYENTLLRDSNYLPALQYLAGIRMQQELYQVALDRYKRIVTLKPQNAAAWKQLSFAAFTAREDDSAFCWLNKAYGLNPADARVVARLAEEWLEKKAYNTADSLINVYLARDSSQAIVLMTGARTSFYKKDYARTLTFGNKLMALNINSPNTFTYVSVAAYNAKQYAQCLDVYNYLKDRNATSQDITYYAALACTRLERYDSSNTLLEMCIKMGLSESLDNYYNGMSANYEAMGQYKQAIYSLDTAFYLFQKPLRQYSIGRIYSTRLKNETVANKYYQRYLQLYKPEATEEEKTVYQYLKARSTK